MPKIALGHYLQTLEADFDNAVQNPVQLWCKMRCRQEPTESTLNGRTRRKAWNHRLPVAFCPIQLYTVQMNIWAGWESNPLPTRYEQAARPLSFRPRRHQFSFPMVRCNGSQAFAMRTMRKPIVFVGRSGCCALRDALRQSTEASTQLPPRMTFKSPPTGPVGSVPAVSK